MLAASDNPSWDFYIYRLHSLFLARGTIRIEVAEKFPILCVEDTAGHKQFRDYADEFEYLTNSGVALAVKAISNPKFPLKESESKNLLKLYLSDVGLEQI